MEGLLEVRKFAHEVLREHQVLHILEFVIRTIVIMFSMAIMPVPSGSKIAVKASF